MSGVISASYVTISEGTGTGRGKDPGKRHHQIWMKIFARPTCLMMENDPVIRA